MKTILLALIFVSVNMCAQIEVKPKDETKTVKVGKYFSSTYSCGDLEYKVNNGDTAIILSFCNEKYTTIVDRKYIIFDGGLKELDTVYKLLKSVNGVENKDNKDYKIEFKLGKTDVTASKQKVFGMKRVFVWTNDGYFTIGDGALDKLFAVK